MALSCAAPFTVVACAIGCASYVQDDEYSASGGGQGGAISAGGGGAFGGMTASPGGANTAGTRDAQLGGATSGGAFSSAGSSGTAGTSAAAGASATAGGMHHGGSSGSGSAAGVGGIGGIGGSGGDTAGCLTHPIPAKPTWTATASVEAGPCPGMPNPDYCGPASRAIDGMLSPVDMTRYTTGVGRTGTEWLQIDFGSRVIVSQIVLTTAAGTDYTHGYEVRMSVDAANIAASAVIASGMGQADATTIVLPVATTGQFLRINQTTSGASWWSIQELDASCQ